MADEHDNLERLDDATSRRLARLGERAVDTSRLEARLEAALGPAPARRARPAHRWLSPAAGIAAALVAAVSLFLVLSHQAPPAAAAAVELSQLHHDLVTGLIPATPVTSIADANAWIDSQQAGAPQLPRDMAGTRVQSCCLRDVQGEIVAVVLMEHQGKPVTLVVAAAKGFALPMGEAFERDGRELFGHTVGGVRMMMDHHDDRWLCVMGDLAYTELADLAAGIEF